MQGADPSLTIPVVSGKSVLGATALTAAFNGVNFNTQRFSDGGNQFSVEPPDMGLAAGNGFVVEAVNDVMNIFDSAGNPLITAASLNQFFYGEHAIRRSPLPFVFGHSVTDPTVYFDHDTQRWFITVLTLDTNPATGQLTGTDHLDIAVSQTSDPRGAWNLNQIDVTAHGDGCAIGSNPCIGDFPHVGADANGFYITTNAFPFFGGYAGINIYALSKAALVANAPLTGVIFSGTNYDTGDYIFSVMPAVTPITGQYDAENGGTEWFMSALDGGAIYDNRISVIALTNTSALNTDPSQLGAGVKIIQTQTYGDALRSEQKAGNYPLGQSQGRAEGKLDSSDARITQAVYANGKLFGSNTTRLQVGANPKVLAGASYYIVKPRYTGKTGATASIWKQGYVAVAGNNLTYSSIGVTQAGKGIMTFSLTGLDYYPSSAYAFVDKVTGIAGDVHVAGAGVGPQDGFSEYGSRPRWGDYSAAAYDGNSVWWAQEYIGQTCTLAQWQADTTCGGTRALNGNWGTFISNVTPP